MSNPKMVKIHVTEAVLKMNGQVYEQGDVVSFTAEDAAVICENGWGDAVNGEFATGERIPGAREIRAHNVTQEL